MSGSRISELARSVGVAASTVRYYERIGLVPAPQRDPSGYRRYGADAENRLRFIVRGKRLGLSLEQIAELLAVWDGTNCAATQAQLGRLLDEKQTEIAAQIRELRRFSTQLAEVRGQLVASPAPDACSTELECCAPSLRAATVPVVCDMRGAPDTEAERIQKYRQLFADALVGHERTETRVRFRFRAGDGIEARVRELGDLEAQCCAFFTFEITVADDEVHWDATVIDDDVARALLEQWFHLPDVVEAGIDQLRDEWTDAGLRFVVDTAG